MHWAILISGTKNDGRDFDKVPERSYLKATPFILQSTEEMEQGFRGNTTAGAAPR